MIVNGENKTNEQGWQYLHINESGRKELFSGIFQTEEEAIDWYKKWGAFWFAKGIELTKHIYKPGFSSNGFYWD